MRSFLNSKGKVKPIIFHSTQRDTHRSSELTSICENKALFGRKYMIIILILEFLSNMPTTNLHRQNM